MINTHHIATDEWSVNLLSDEIGAAYSALVAGESPRLPELAVQYSDYARWQCEWLSAEGGAERERQLSYWRDRLAGAPLVLDLPTDRPRPAVQSHVGGTVSVDIPEDVVRALRSRCNSSNVSLFMMLLSAFDVLLSRYSGADELVVGAPIAGRSRAECHRSIGCFVNTLALRVDMSGLVTVDDLLSRVRKCCLDAYSHADVLRC